MQGHLIVANCLDGTVQKGTSLDVDPKRPTCHIKTAMGGMIEVPLAGLNALVFGKTATGLPDYNDAGYVAPLDSRLVGARRVRVAFAVGEEIVGLMNRFPPITPYFYMLPIDPHSNNIRILVNRAAVKEMNEVTGS